MKWRSDGRFYKGYDPATPLAMESITPDEEREGVVYEHLRMQGVPEMTVPLLLARPVEKGNVRRPAIIFLHGIGQSKGFLPEIAGPFVSNGFIMVSFDQYMRGERKPEKKRGIREVWDLRRRTSLTVIETRRMVDALIDRDDVDPNRIYLIGASYGAITGAVATALEPRLRAAVLVYGGGDLGKLLDSPLARESLGFWLRPVIWLAKYLLGAADPVRYVDRIAPRPILFQGGEEDRLVPPKSVQALYDAASEPKELIWYPGDHLEPGSPMVKRVLDDALAWLIQQDGKPPTEG